MRILPIVLFCLATAIKFPIAIGTQRDLTLTNDEYLDEKMDSDYDQEEKIEPATSKLGYFGSSFTFIEK